MAANAPRPWGGCEDAREEKSRAEGERLETIKISVAERHKDGTYSKRTKKKRKTSCEANAIGTKELSLEMLMRVERCARVSSSKYEIELFCVVCDIA